MAEMDEKEPRRSADKAEGQGETPAECFAAAEKFLDNGLYDEAIIAYRRGLEQDPQNLVAMNNLAMVHMEKADYAAAKQELERALALREDAEILANLGYVLRKLGDDAAAASCYERYLALAPQAEDADAIRRWLERLRQPPVTSPANEAAITVEAEAAYAAEDYEKALALYNRALEMNVDSPVALTGRGRCQAKLGLWEEALASLREAAALAPEDSETWFVIGFVLRKLERNVEAAEALEKFLSLAPADERAEKIRAFIAETRAAAQLAPAAAREEAPEAESPAKAEASAAVETAATAVAPEPLAQAQQAAVETAAAAASSFAVKGKRATPAEAAANLTVEQRLEIIRDDVEKGDVNVALAKAQELVGQYPDCTAAKLIIARCFGKKGEFAKAAVILENFLAGEASNEEALFLLGRCQQEMGKLKEARLTLERCRALAKDEERKARIEELLRGFSGSGKGICASCAESVPQSQLQEVNGRKVCPNCRQRLESALGGQAAIMAAETPGEKPQAPATKTPPARRPFVRSAQSPLALIAKSAALVVLIAAAVLVGLYKYKPAAYEDLRKMFPAFLPLPSSATAVAPRPPASKPQPLAKGDAAATVAAPEARKEEKNPDKPDAPLALEAPETAAAVADFPFYLRLQTPENTEKSGEIKYTLEFSRPPAAPYSFDEKTGELKWTPSAADCAEPFTLVFGAICGDRRAEAARCTVRVKPPLGIRAIGLKMETAPGAAACLAAGDLNGDGQPELLAATGEFWQSRLAVYAPSAGRYAEVAAIDLEGRPLAMRVADFGRGRMAAIVDAWQNMIRFLAWQDGKFTLLAEKIDLPERPALAAFGNPDGKGGEGVAVLGAQSRKIFVYDVGEEGLTLVREVTLPASGLWKSMQLANFFSEAEDSWQEISLIQAGPLQPNVYFSPLAAAGDWLKCNVGSGAAQAASVLKENGDARLGLISALREANFYLVRGRKADEPVKYETIALKTSEPLLAMAVADLDGDRRSDAALFFRHALLVHLGSDRRSAIKEMPWPQTVKPPLGPTAVMAVAEGDAPQKVVWWDRSGNLLLLGCGAQ